MQCSTQQVVQYDTKEIASKNDPMMSCLSKPDWTMAIFASRVNMQSFVHALMICWSLHQNQAAETRLKYSLIVPRSHGRSDRRRRDISKPQMLEACEILWYLIYRAKDCGMNPMDAEYSALTSAEKMWKISRNPIGVKVRHCKARLVRPSTLSKGPDLRPRIRI